MLTITIGFPLSGHELIVYVVILLRAIILFRFTRRRDLKNFLLYNMKFFPTCDKQVIAMCPRQ